MAWCYRSAREQGSGKAGCSRGRHTRSRRLHGRSREQVPLGGGGWPPRTVAEHIIIALGVYSEFMADALGEPHHDWASQDFTFTSADTARSALRDLSTWSRGFLSGLDDHTLDTPVPEMADSSRLPPTIEGVLSMATNHLQEHARQIATSVKM